MIKTYKIKVKSQGRITQLLDSQKIFGALMYLLVKDERVNVTGFVRQVKSDKKFFMVSNLLPNGYLPTPHGDVKNKVDYQKIKSMKFVPEVLKGTPIIEIKDYLTIHESQVQQYRLSNEFYEVPGLENELFSVPIIKILKQGAECKDFCFYIAFDEADEDSKRLIECLKNIIAEEKAFLFGQRASQGYNTYQAIGIDEEIDLPWENTIYYLNIGMLLPNEIDFKNSQLKLFTSERRPYELDFGQEFKRADNFISFIEAGSVIETSKFLNSGKCIDSPYKKTNEERIVFGKSFLYPLEKEWKLS